MQSGLIKFFGLQRSGNHAVLNWILGLDRGLLFFNSVRPYSSPLNSMLPVSLPAGARAPKYREGGTVREGVQMVKGAGPDGNGPVLCSFENADLARLDQARVNQALFDDVGRYTSVRNVLVVRNPLNMLASYARLAERSASKRSKLAVAKDQTKFVVRSFLGRIEETELTLGFTWRAMSIDSKLKHMLRLWKTYARLAVHPRSESRGDFLPIVFDRWVVRRDYRDQIAELLGYQNQDSNLHFVSDAGGGSSWEGTGLDVDVDRMSVLTRWKGFRSQELLLRLTASDYELHDLCNALFERKHLEPVIPGPVFPQPAMIG